MVDHQSDESLYRLQASDPATGAHPDLERVRQLVAQKAPASQRAAGDRARRIDDELLQGPRLRAPWIAAAAIVALGIGAGGYALGVSRDDGTVLMANQDSLLSPAAGGSIGATSSLDLGSASASGGESAPQPYDPGPVRLVAADGLSNERTTGQVRTLMTDEVPEDYLARWTEAMDLQGTSVTDSDYFGFGDGVGTFDQENGEWAMVGNPDGGLSFMYTSIFRVEGCREMHAQITQRELDEFRKEWERVLGEGTPLPTASDCIPPEGTRPTDDEAIAQATAFLADAGVPVEDYTVRVPDYGERTSLYVPVEAWPTGYAYGPLHASATVGPAGVVEAYGSIGEMTSLGDYPVISPTEAVERYGEREFSMEYGISLPEDYAELERDPDATITFLEPDIDEAPEVAEGMKVPLLLKDKEVTSAELVQGMMWTQSGSMEVPTWKLKTDDGMTYPVLALADEAILYQSWEQPE